MTRSTARSLPTAAVFAAAFASAGPAAAEALAADPMVGNAGSLKAELPSPGFLGAWGGKGMAYAGGGGLTGAGWAARNVAVKVDFERAGEYFFRTTVGRSGLGGGSDHASIGLFTKDASVNNRPLKVGFSSGNTLLVSLGEERADVKLGEAGVSATGPITIAARLVTRPSAEGLDRMEVWAWPAGNAAPASVPSRPDGVIEADYDGASNTVRIDTGNAAGFAATFGETRIATDWNGLFAGIAYEDVPPAQTHPYRDFTHVRLAPDATQPLPVQWAGLSLIPRGEGEAPELLVLGSSEWIPAASMAYRPVDAATRAEASPAPTSGLPLYDGGHSDHGFANGRYQAVPREAGGFDLYHLQRLEHVGEVSATGERTMFAKPRPIGLAAPAAGGDETRTAGPAERVEPGERAAALRDLALHSDFFLGDADGDGVTDLLIGRQVDRAQKRMYWPDGSPPWTIQPQTNVGPHTDTQNTPGFRGYGVDGQWLGTRVNYALQWARGSRASNGDLVLGPRQPVYLGRDDYPVQWRNFSQRMVPAMIERDGTRHVLLFSAVSEALALPVLTGTPEGSLHLGAAQNLLASEADARDIIIPYIVGVQDLDGDGTKEVVVGSGSAGRAVALGGEEVGAFRRLGVLENVGGVVGAATLAIPAVGDWDGDGTPDLVTGDGAGYYLLFPGTDDPMVFRGARTLKDSSGHDRRYVGEQNLQGPQERGWGYTQPELFDWDADGTLDLIGNDNTATFRLLKRTDPGDPAVTSEAVFTRAGSDAKLPVSWRHRPAGVPGACGVAGDDRPVLLYLNAEQNLVAGVPTRTGSTEIEREIPMNYQDGRPVRTSGSAGMSGRTAFAVTDMDDDGVWDVLFGTVAKNVQVYNPDPVDQATTEGLKSSSAFWIRNAGTAAEPVFEPARRIRWADGGVTRVETHGFAVAPRDADGDGRWDLLYMGDGPGFVYGIRRDELDLSAD
ncbi:FG-GAP repeat domain-containing protein [Phycisphaera mikurensis]|uniref:Uncharacterized protein n=1 Tax=Phycisphaera mikurensis (strain NBRC 102666 / KCTC 22515 / FYK2301M01) TaxID=1142394 RepID=I0IDG8_PHYMF|nr:VCBS repeat-containing protein [Phycisphaera mikurensis]MBB6441127.1 hypothetical protein [Phycisphaera mikurensis]BAM03306.1 hypothetical protein PSMK_11470 [Phycisphaera mikurensis NBRC 102666]